MIALSMWGQWEESISACIGISCTSAIGYRRSLVKMGKASGLKGSSFEAVEALGFGGWELPGALALGGAEVALAEEGGGGIRLPMEEVGAAFHAQHHTGTIRSETELKLISTIDAERIGRAGTALEEAEDIINVGIVGGGPSGPIDRIDSRQWQVPDAHQRDGSR